MKGLELCRRYFEEYGRPLIEKYGGYGISAGVAGYGSECFGYDDEYSKDHDFEPFFYIWLDDETDRETGFELNKAYRRLPTEYLGIKATERSLYGARKGGVITVKDFFRVFTLCFAELSTHPPVFLGAYTSFLTRVREMSSPPSP